MREFIELCGLIIASTVAFVASCIGIIFILALPFIAIGMGFGLIGWTFCLFVSVC